MSLNVSPLFAQLPLGVRLRDGATFANYHAGANREAVALLQATVDGAEQPCVFLWGPPGTGKTHLLHAAAHHAAARPAAVAYLPFAERAALTPALLDGLEQLPLVALDDLDAIAGDAAWETAVFHLYNRVREAGGQLIAAARANPASLALGLADLRSRLAWGPVIQLYALDDADKAEALRLKARQRGLELPTEVAALLLRRCRRDMAALFAVLDELDHASLAAQRRLTVPFVKSVLDSRR